MTRGESKDLTHVSGRGSREQSHAETISGLLFLGGVFPRDEEASIVARCRGPVQGAANALQWSLITGLDVVMRRPISVLNAVFVGPYPQHYSRIWIAGRRWSHAPGARDKSIGFVNLFAVKHLWRVAALTVSACRWSAGASSEGPRSIVIYSMHAPFLLAAAMAKAVDRSLKVCVVVPDLPEHMNLSHVGRLLRAFKAMDRWILDLVLRHMDCFVFLTRHMAERLGVAGRPWIVMEGAVNPEDANAESWPQVPDNSLKVVLYTGTLHKAYGILDLLEAFSLVPDPTCRMWICGAGDAEPEVRSMVARDPRVRYLGQLTRGEVLTLQRNATVLINPRGDTAEFTKYSFPSKILEYMLSGTPAIVRRLPGMPEEYFDYLFVVEGSAPADMAKKISEVCNRPSAERVQFGERARRFVIEQKSCVMQAGRILDLIRRA